MKTAIKVLKIGVLFMVLFGILITALFGYRDIPLSLLKSKYAPSPSSFILIDGLDVHYRDEGKLTDSVPIVLIHGTGSSLHTFDAWTSVLKNDYRVVRLDLPGFGLTGPFTDRDYSIAHYVVFMKQFLAEKGIEKCILAGNSLGGEIAWQFTVENPAMVEKLILIDAAGYHIASKSVPIAFKLARTPVLNKVFTFISPRFVIQSSIENVYADQSKVTESLVDRYFELSLRAGNRQAFIDRLQLVKHTNNISLIQNIQQPCLVLWGEEDLLIPIEHALRFHDDLPNDTLVILKNTGHVPMEENSKESLSPLLNFLKKKEI